MTEPRRILGDRYEVIRILGSGGMGTVFEAVDRRFGNRVAIKRLDISGPAVERAFEREARLLRDLKHDGLPRVIDHFEHENSAYLVMDYVGGDDLSQALATQGRFTVADVVGIVRAVLGILEYLHGRTPPVLHRDIKPQNLKVHDGQVYLLDFGLAKGDASAREGAAGASSIAGYSPHYAPLEQIRGVGTRTWSDVYALAATMYCLLTGTRPADALERATAAATGEPDPLVPPSEANPSVPPQLSQLLIGAMSPNPAHRPRDASAMRRELERALTFDDEATITESRREPGMPADRTVVESVASSSHARTLVAEPATVRGSRRSRRAGRVAALTAIVGLVAAVGVAFWSGARLWKSDPAHGSPMLVVGSSVERDIAPGDLHEFHVVARAGDAIRVSLSRVEGRRFAVAMSTSTGDTLVEVRQGNGARLPVFWVAEVDGAHVISVRLSKLSGSGRYRLALDGCDDATPAEFKLLREQDAMLSALAFDAERARRARAMRATGPGRPTERRARAWAMLRDTEVEAESVFEKAAAICRTSEEPVFRVWADDAQPEGVDSPRGSDLVLVGFRGSQKGLGSPARDNIVAIYRGLQDVQGEAAYLLSDEGASLCAEIGYMSGEAAHLLRANLMDLFGSPNPSQEKTRAGFLRALEIARALGDGDMISHAALFLSFGHGSNPSEDVVHFAEAIEHSRSRGDVPLLAEYLDMRATRLEEANRLKEATADYEEAANQFKAAQMPYHHVRALLRLETILRKTGDKSRAEAAAREARAVERSLGVLSNELFHEEVAAEVSPLDPDLSSF